MTRTQTRESETVSGLLRRLERRKALRTPFEPGWAECYDYTFPERGNGLNSAVVSAAEAQSKKNRILDDTAADAARILSSGTVSGTTPANSRWFSLDAGQESEDEKRWLDDAAQVIFENIHAASFDAAVFECTLDLVVAGWFVLYIDSGKDDGYCFEQWPIAQCWIAASRPGGLVDCADREVELTVEQLVREYGYDAVSEPTRSAYDNERYDDKVKVLHSIHPRPHHKQGARRNRHFPWASYHVEIPAKHLLRESGYHEFPCVVPRWMVAPGSAYATGPMAQALGSIRTLNDIKALELANLDMSTCGMYIAEDDGVLNPRSIKIGPRKVIVANSVDSMRELKSGGDFSVTFTAEERLQAQIRKIMLADQLQPQGGPAMSATEVQVRVQLIRQLLGPIYGRLQAEYLKPLIDRCFGIAWRAGVLGAAPEALQGRVFNVRYISPLARAQKMEEAGAIDQYVSGAVAMAQAYPDILDTIDFDAAQKVKGEALGVPAAVMRSGKQVANLRKQRADAQQQAMQAQQMAAMQSDVVSRATPELVKKI